MKVVSPNFRHKNLISLYILGEILLKFSLTPFSTLVTLNAKSFNLRSCMGCFGGPDPIVLLGNTIIRPIQLDSTPERQLMVSEIFSVMHQLMTEAKILDSKGNELVKPPFLYSDSNAVCLWRLMATRCFSHDGAALLYIQLPTRVNCSHYE